MFNPITAFSGLAVDDLAKAKDFYVQVLGLQIEDETMGLQLRLPGGGYLFVYPRPDHEPAGYTALNLVVENIDAAVVELMKRGVHFERYSDLPAPQDEKGILRGLSVNQGPDIAWFKDPSGNILSVLQDK